MAVADDETVKPPPRVIDGTQKDWADWTNGEAKRRAERFAKRKPGLDSARRMHRAGMTAFELHRHAVEREAKISTVSAPPVGRSSPNSERERPGPPAQQTLDQDPRWQEGWAVIRRRLLDMHGLLDEAEGLGAAPASTMFTEQKDQLILRDGRGYSPEAVVDLLGREIGGPRTIEYVRKREGYCPRDGEPLTEEPCEHRWFLLNGSARHLGRRVRID